MLIRRVVEFGRSGAARIQTEPACRAHLRPFSAHGETYHANVPELAAPISARYTWGDHKRKGSCPFEGDGKEQTKAKGDHGWEGSGKGVKKGKSRVTSKESEREEETCGS